MSTSLRPHAFCVGILNGPPLGAREDYVALTQVVCGCRRSMVVRLMLGIILHGFYHRAAVEAMAAALRLPSDRGLSCMEWTLASQRVYDDMPKLGREYEGPQGFPYRWIKSGTQIAESLRVHLSTLYDACVRIVACSRPTISTIDSILPAALGWYSLSGNSRCKCGGTLHVG